MPYIKIEANLEVYCAECGRGICSEVSEKSTGEIYVGLCPHCKKEYEDRIKDLENDLEIALDEVSELKEKGAE